MWSGSAMGARQAYFQEPSPLTSVVSWGPSHCLSRPGKTPSPRSVKTLNSQFSLLDVSPTADGSWAQGPSQDLMRKGLWMLPLDQHADTSFPTYAVQCQIGADPGSQAHGNPVFPGSRFYYFFKNFATNLQVKVFNGRGGRVKCT